MPKRPCPFDDAPCSPQTKVHVGARQVDEGVMKKDKMKAVYDRTLSLLFSGAKNMENNNVAMTLAPHHQPGAHPALHQLCLTPHGTLTKTRTKEAPQRQTSNSCGSCRSLTTPFVPPCSYCDARLCESCLSSCDSCQGPFCPKCSLTAYGNQEKSVCLSCC